MTIKSISDNQEEILKSILSLNNIDSFDCDATFGNGRFYKNLKKPALRFDIDDSCNDCVKACSTNLPIENECITSLVFDPPFLTYIRSAREHDCIMAKRFGGYWNYKELENHYKGTLKEASRVLKKNGVLIFKCQDIIHNHKMHCTHVNIINWAQNEGFRLKDLFVLLAKHKMSVPQKFGVKKRKQKHARVYHSYFLVLKK